MLITTNELSTPSKATKNSACIDLRSSEHTEVLPGTTAIIDLGVKLDQDYLASTKDHFWLQSHYLSLHPRSSLRAKGIISGEGIIDMDYPNTLKLIVHNFSKNTWSISPGDRIAQLMLCTHESVLFDFKSNDNRIGGLGSTG